MKRDSELHFKNQPKKLVMLPRRAVQQPQFIVVNERYQSHYEYMLKLYVSNRPDHFSKDNLATQISIALAAAGGVLEQSSPIKCVLNLPGRPHFWQLNFRSIEETSACLELDGLVIGNRAIRISRPKEFFENNQRVRGSRQIRLDTSRLLIRKLHPFIQQEQKIFLAGYPLHLNEEDLIVMLSRFGFLKGFHLAFDKLRKLPKGFCFFSYYSQDEASMALCRMNSEVWEGRRLIARRVPHHKDNDTQPLQLARVENKNMSPQELSEQKYLTFPLQCFMRNKPVSSVVLLKGLTFPPHQHDFVGKDLRKQYERIGRVNQVKFAAEGVLIQFVDERAGVIAVLASEGSVYNKQALLAEFIQPQKYLDEY